MKLVTVIVCVVATFSNLVLASEQIPTTKAQKLSTAIEESQQISSLKLAQNDTSCMDKCEKAYDICMKDSKGKNMPCANERDKCYLRCK